MQWTERGPVTANPDQGLERGVGREIPPLVPKVSARNAGITGGVEGRVTRRFLCSRSQDAAAPAVSVIDVLVVLSVVIIRAMQAIVDYQAWRARRENLERF